MPSRLYTAAELDAIRYTWTLPPEIAGKLESFFLLRSTKAALVEELRYTQRGLEIHRLGQHYLVAASGNNTRLRFLQDRSPLLLSCRILEKGQIGVMLVKSIACFSHHATDKFGEL